MAELPTQRDFEDFSAWTGRDVLAPDGERLGAVELIFLDEATGVPEWVLVRLDEATAPSSRSPARASRSARSASSRTASASPPRRGSRSGTRSASPSAAALRALRPRVLAGGVPDRAARGRRAPSSEERPRLRKYVGAPVAAPEADEAAAERAAGGRTSAATAEPRQPQPIRRTCRATQPATPSPLPPASRAPSRPRAASRPARSRAAGRLARCGTRPALPIALAGAIAAPDRRPAPAAGGASSPPGRRARPARTRGRTASTRACRSA